jgi:hypothetical protein
LGVITFIGGLWLRALWFDRVWANGCHNVDNFRLAAKHLRVHFATQRLIYQTCKSRLIRPKDAKRVLVPVKLRQSPSRPAHWPKFFSARPVLIHRLIIFFPHRWQHAKMIRHQPIQN